MCKAQLHGSERACHLQHWEDSSAKSGVGTPVYMVSLRALLLLHLPLCMAYEPKHF